MNIDSSINPMPARRAERSSLKAEIFAKRFIDCSGVSLLFFCHGRTCSGHPRAFAQRCFKDVDARDKPGHDELNQLLQRHLCDASFR
jgi:hypothetical protein